MPRSLEEACPCTPAAPTSSITTIVRQEIWLRHGHRGATAALHLLSAELSAWEDNRAQCVAVAALKAAMTIDTCASV